MAVYWPLTGSYSEVLQNGSGFATVLCGQSHKALRRYRGLDAPCAVVPFPRFTSRGPTPFGQGLLDW
jgi:hypothetical protein